MYSEVKFKVVPSAEVGIITFSHLSETQVLLLLS